MIFHVLRETPENSGTYTATGEVLDTSVEDASNHVLDAQAAQGGRWAVAPYEPIRRAPDVAAPATPAAPATDSTAAPAAPAQ